jgi:hypothetical protein
MRAKTIREFTLNDTKPGSGSSYFVRVRGSFFLLSIYVSAISSVQYPFQRLSLKTIIAPARKSWVVPAAAADADRKTCRRYAEKAGPDR